MNTRSTQKTKHDVNFIHSTRYGKTTCGITPTDIWEDTDEPVTCPKCLGKRTGWNSTYKAREKRLQIQNRKERQ